MNIFNFGMLKYSDMMSVFKTQLIYNFDLGDIILWTKNSKKR